jgi:hypothetical protein
LRIAFLYARNATWASTPRGDFQILLATATGVDKKAGMNKNRTVIVAIRACNAAKTLRRTRVAVSSRLAALNGIQGLLYPKQTRGAVHAS